MTNKEKYQRAFSALHASEWNMEELNMKQKKYHTSRAAVLCAAIILVLGLATVAYAADFAGIQRQIQIWMHGDQTDAVFEYDDGTYSITYQDENGKTRTNHGGGVAVDFFGRERSLTEEEILESLNPPEVVYQDDGTVWVYYYDQRMEITDLFEDGVCYVQIKHNDETLYLSVRYQNGYSYSSDGYPGVD